VSAAPTQWADAFGVPRPWRVGRVAALSDLAHPTRLTAIVVRLGLQVFLVAALWTALYAHTPVSAGMTVHQAVGYMVLATLCTRMRDMDRYTTNDAVPIHVRDGTILYWYLRPMSARRYHRVRGYGEQLYMACWALAGYGVCLACGVVTAPVSFGAGLAFAASLVLAQVIVYHLGTIVDLACFWTTVNGSSTMIYQFAQNLLSGAFAPLWFFPHWFVAVDDWLPFQSTLNVPLSLYVGRIRLADAWQPFAVQLLWCVLLALITRRMWRAADRRVAVQGG
jgi:ABC-2 type transport system permease protein